MFVAHAHEEVSGACDRNYVELDSGYRRIRDSRVGTTVVPSRTRERASVRTPTAVNRIVIWQVLMGSVLKIAVTNVTENANGSSSKVNAENPASAAPRRQSAACVRACAILRLGNGVLSDGFWVAVLIVIGVVVYTLANVVAYVRKSNREWQNVDRSKLREWNDDDEW